MSPLSAQFVGHGGKSLCARTVCTITHCVYIYTLFIAIKLQ